MDDNELALRLSGDPSGALSAIGQVKEGVSGMADEIVNHAARMVAALFSIEKAFEGVKAGIMKADEIRDLQLSLDVFTGSVEKGTAAMQFFRDQADKTRNTAEELGAAFRTILPLGESRGLSQGAIQDMTVMLSQLATIANVSLEAMESGLKRLESGGGAGGAARNPLAAVLGLTKTDLDNLTFGKLFEDIQAKTKDFDQFGQSFESAMHKAKEAWEVAFGEGFNQAMGGGRAASEAFMNAWKDPAFLKALEQIGATMAAIAVVLPGIVEGFLKIPLAISGGLQSPGWMQAITDFMGHISQSSTQPGGWQSWDLSGAQFYSGNQQQGPRQGGASGSWATPAEEAAADAAKNWRDILGHVYDQHVKIRQAAKDAADAEKELADHFANLANINLTYQYAGGYSPFQQYNLGLFGQLGGGPNLPSQYAQYGGGMPKSVSGQQPSAEFQWLTPEQLAPVSQSFAEQFSMHLREAISGQEFQRPIADMLTAAATEGGRGFAEAASRGLQEMLAGMIAQVVPTYNHKTGQFEVGGKPASNQTAAATVAGAAGVIEIGAGGYQAGLSGAPGAQTGAAISGLVGGAGIGAEVGSALPGIGTAMGAIVGAVVGLIAGEIGAALGAAARRADYQYGIPEIIKGVAGVGGPVNLVPSAVDQITRQVQEEYDQIHSGLINLILKFPDLAIPSFDNIVGKFQDNPSAHWGEHLQQWITGTLPHDMMAAVGDELATGFEKLGMTSDAFKKIFSFLQGIDPTKAINELSMLADGLKMIASAQGFFGYNTGLFGPGSESYQKGMMDLSIQGAQTPGQKLAAGDAQILKLGSVLQAGGLSPEEQIAYIGQIGTLMKQRYDTELAAIQEIYNVSKSIKDSFQSAQDTLGLQGMVNPDGTPNYGAQSKFYSDKSQKDLALIYGSASAADVQKYSQQYINDIMQAEQLGIQGGGNLQQWNAWASSALPAGQAAATQALTNLGQSINNANTAFAQQLDPALAAFTGQLTTTNVIFGDFGGAINKVIPDIGDLGHQANAAADALTAFAAKLNGFEPPTGGGSSGASFTASTLAARLAS